MSFKTLTFPKELPYEDWIAIRDAIILDCDTILESYKHIHDEPAKYGSEANEATHKSNAIYMKNELSDKLDGEMSSYKTPMGIWEWIKILIREDFFCNESNKSEFRFPNAKQKWLATVESFKIIV